MLFSDMKVLMVIDRYIPIWGGAENQLRQLIPHLTGLGCKVSILTRRWEHNMPKREWIDGIPVKRIGWPGMGTLSTMIYCCALAWHLLMMGNSVSVIHTHGAALLGAAGSWAVRLLRKVNVALIGSAGRVHSLQNTLPGRFVLSFLKRSNAIISLSDEIYYELRDIGTPPHRIFRIPNAVDTERFKRSSENNRKTWRIEHSLDPADLVVVITSHLKPGKGHQSLLAAWKSVVMHHPKAHLMIVGSGRNHPKSLEHKLRYLATFEGIANVHFEGETSTPEAYLGAADLFVLPSRSEGCSNAILEAMAAELPVVACNVGGVRDVIDSGKNGMLIPPNSDNILAEIIIKLLGNRRLSRELGKAAREKMLKNHGFSATAGHYVNLYRQLVLSRSHPVHNRNYDFISSKE
jgi:glycosyltransferase involved in cell wall biosynthesis